jgi:hypothetical protein
MKLEQGDCVERCHLEWIRTNVPEYEHIWCRFIGHDGYGEMLPLNNWPDNLADKRKAFSQAHYSALVGILQIREICEEFRIGPCEGCRTRDLLTTLRYLTTFAAYLGQIRDMCKKMDECLNLGGRSWRRLNDFYEKQNHLLHGPIPLHKMDHGGLQMAEIAGMDRSDSLWDDKKLWSQSPMMRFQLVVVFLEETFSNLIPLFRAALSGYLTEIKLLEASHDLSLQKSDRWLWPNEDEVLFEMTAGSAVIREYKKPRINKKCDNTLGK